MDPSLFGSRLRMARERRRLTLQELATRTKLSASLFASLENGTCHGWPVGVCSRAHVRTYAELVGLDAGEVVDDFSALFPHLAWSEQDQAREVIAALRPSVLTPARRGITVAPLRLVFEDEPVPFWRAWLTRLAWVAHRLANGGVTNVAPVAAAASVQDEESDGEAALVPLSGLQVD